MIREIYTECVGHGTVRAKGYHFLTLAMFRHIGMAQPNEAKLMRAIEADYASAEEAIKTVVERLEASGTQSSPELSLAARNVFEGIEKIRPVLQAINQKTDLDKLGEGYAIQSTRVFPAFTKFLDQFALTLDRHEQHEKERSSSTIVSAMHEFDRISDTINLIAVNASVEAARLAEEGQGFAVIANEIKTLSTKARERVNVIRSHMN